MLIESSAGTHVWYASYGSNVHRGRFLYYLQGGRPCGSSVSYAGSVDTAPPLADLPMRFPRSMYFALESTVWTGGTAFLDHGPGASIRVDVPAYGRAYLVTKRQFEDVVAQENHREHHPIDFTGMGAGESRSLGSGRYETLLCTGYEAGAPVVTFTCSGGRPDVPPASPSIAYLRMLAAGLTETHRLTSAEVAAYLASRSGACGSWTAESLLTAL